MAPRIISGCSAWAPSLSTRQTAAHRQTPAILPEVLPRPSRAISTWSDARRRREGLGPLHEGDLQPFRDFHQPSAWNQRSGAATTRMSGPPPRLRIVAR